MRKIFDTASLKIRLTAGIATVTALGLGSLAAWTSMRMQQMLVSTHKENLKYIAARFPKDVEIYSEMIPIQQGVQRAISSLSTPKQLIWLKNSKNQVIARSQTLHQAEISNTLLTVNNVPLIPQVRDLNGNYWLMCATPLRVKNVSLGQLYLAQNITQDQTIRTYAKEKFD
ncbi:MAG: hypothetical protein ACFCU7_18235 [Pleurocapsa sp.]